MTKTRRTLVLGGLLASAVVVALAFATGFSLGELGAHRWKAAIAFAALALVGLERRRRRGGRPAPGWAAPALASFLAVLAFGAYYNFGNPVYEGLFHRNNVFHHFLGAKYAPELSYTRLYECVAVAQAELGESDAVRARRMRNLEDDSIVLARTALEHPEACTSRFSPERWAAFVADVRFFRGSADRTYWDEMQLDHGFNAPPVWTAGVHLVTRGVAATRPIVLGLASLDVLCVLGAIAAIAWAFGWRVASLATIFFGCQHPANHLWVSGSLLRFDWFFFVALSVAALKKRMPLLAGVAIAWATTLRVFPALLLLGPAVIVAEHALRRRALARSHVRFIAGGLAAGMVLVAASLVVLGPRSYEDFARHIKVHAETPAANHMGLRALFMIDYDGSQERSVDPTQPDPLRGWRDARVRQYRSARPLFFASALAIVGAFAFAVRRRRALWIGLALSVVPLFALAQLASYYFAVFVVAVVLARVRPALERFVLFFVGLGAVAVTMPAFSSVDEKVFATQSAVYLAFSLGLLMHLWPRRRPRV